MSPAASNLLLHDPGRQKPRILFVTHCSKLSGAELQLCDLVSDFFPRSKIFLFEDGPLRLETEAVGVYPTVGRHLDPLLRIRRDDAVKMDVAFAVAMISAIVQLARVAHSCELVYANSQKAFVTAALAAPLAKRPLVWHLHDVITAEHFRTKQLRVAIGLANRVAKRVIVPSQAVGDAFCAAGGRGDKVRVVPNGVSVPVGTRSLDRAKLRAELGLPPGFLLSVIGRISPEKGQHVMLEVLTLLPDAQCIIVGEALFGENDYVERLHQLVEGLGLSERVRFLGNRADVPRLMRASDIVVQTSVRPEAFSRVIIEAMLCGTLIVAPRAGGATEILTGDLAALLYSPGDSVALANLLRSFWQREHCRARLVELGIARAERNFAIVRMQCKIYSVILEILGARQ